MRGQEISPWSIYNQTLRPHDDPQTPKEEKTRFPKIQKLVTQRHRHEEARVKRRHSSLALNQNQSQKSEPFSPYASELTPKGEKSRQQQIKNKQSQIEAVLYEYAAVRLIRQQLKRQAAQIDFLRILQQQSLQQQQPPAPPLQITKKERSFLLDHRVFPKLAVDKNIVLVSMKEESEGSYQELSQSKIKQLLKKEISSMISNRMKIMGRAKKINQKP